MCEEPDFIAQCDLKAEAQPIEPWDWFVARQAEFAKAGATWFRYSRLPEPQGLCLIEGWKTRPRDQGPIRWQLAAA